VGVVTRGIVIVVIENISSGTASWGWVSTAAHGWLQVSCLIMINFEHTIYISDNKYHVDKSVYRVVASQACLVFKLVHHLRFYNRIVCKNGCGYGLWVPTYTCGSEILSFIRFICCQQFADDTFIAHLNHLGIYLRPQKNAAILWCTYNMRLIIRQTGSDRKSLIGMTFNFVYNFSVFMSDIDESNPRVICSYHNSIHIKEFEACNLPPTCEFPTAVSAINNLKKL
jgi:hypothetical protein